MSNNIQPNRRYPIRSGPFSRHAFVTGVDASTGRVAYYQVPFGLAGSKALQQAPMSAFAAMVRSGAQEQHERFHNAARMEGHHDHDWFVSQRDRYKAIQEGNLPPEGSIFDEVRIDIAVLPSAAFDEATRGRDFWGHIDSLTGGCCNTSYSGGAHEATVYGVKDLEAFLNDPLIGDAVAITMEAPEEVLAREDLPALFAQLRALPTIDEFRAGLQAESLKELAADLGVAQAKATGGMSM